MSVTFLPLLMILLVWPEKAHGIQYTHNYYLGKYENRGRMNLLFTRSQKSESNSGKDEWLAATLTYPLNLGPYGGLVLAVHVQVTQTTSRVGRLT